MPESDTGRDSSTMEGRVALVTGAASGIGRAVAERFLRSGAFVIAVDNAADGLDRLQSGTSRTCLVTQVADVRDPLQLEAAVALGVERFGSLDTLAAVAGVARRGAVESMSNTDRDFVFDVNFFGAWNAARAAIPHVTSSANPRRLLFCGSVESVLATPNMGAYVASKHAVVGLAKALALELADAYVTVNVVSPAGVETPMLVEAAGHDGLQAIADTTPIRRLSTPGEIAAAFLFLSGEEAGYITGENLVIDGGVKLLNSHNETVLRHD